jgi:ferredoxin
MPVIVDTLQDVIAALQERGFTVIGPRERSGAIVFDEVRDAGELAAGWIDEQDGGRYRLVRSGDETLFRHAAGPESLKRFLFPPRVAAWRATRAPDGALTIESGGPVPRYAFIGVRACDLHAVAIQDRVFLEGAAIEPDYAARRREAFFVAVNCTRAGGTCFCVSMDSGPRVTGGFDLSLTELSDRGGHRFVVEAGSDRGAEVLAAVAGRPAGEADVADADAAVAAAAESMGRSLETSGLRELLRDNAEHPRWDAVSERCLSCGNCTMVCPTCFCSAVEDTTDLLGTEAGRTRVWDSCFSLEHSYVHGGSVRRTTRSRYRQWMTHKLSTWIDQFGSSGCVGCGRCIAWCPVGIDITEEVAAIRADGG